MASGRSRASASSSTITRSGPRRSSAPLGKLPPSGTSQEPSLCISFADGFGNDPRYWVGHAVSVDHAVFHEDDAVSWKAIGWALRTEWTSRVVVLQSWVRENPCQTGAGRVELTEELSRGQRP